jgi:hypothetical protein
LAYFFDQIRKSSCIILTIKYAAIFIAKQNKEKNELCRFLKKIEKQNVFLNRILFLRQTKPLTLILVKQRKKVK